MLEELKDQVCKANRLLPEYGLVTFTWGNVSALNAQRTHMVIKPSGVPYEALSAADMVVMDIKTGQVLEGRYAPSSDAPTHLYLYRHFLSINGIVHTHSTWATIWAQAGRGIPAYGTTHGDYFYGEIPCTRPMTKEEIVGSYEENTGCVIRDSFISRSPTDIPAVLVYSHGPFAWGADAMEAVHNAVVLEEVAHMAGYTELVQGGRPASIQQELLDRHYQRKHGENAYYGQKE